MADWIIRIYLSKIRRRAKKNARKCWNRREKYKYGNLSTTGHLCSSFLGMRILVLAFLPSTLLFLFRTIQIKNPIRPAGVLTHMNILNVVKLGLSKEDVKQIIKRSRLRLRLRLRDNYKRNLQDQYMRDSTRGLTIKIKQKDLVTIFPEKATIPFNWFIGRIQ